MKSNTNISFLNDVKLKTVLEKLIPVFKPLQVYLFGSTAREQAGPDSDYDLMFIVSDTAPPELKKSKLAYQTLFGTGIGADILIWTESNFNRRLHVITSLPATIKREGKLLYAQ